MAPDIELTRQELVVHLFAPVDGPFAEAAYARIRELWTRCQEHLGMVAPIGGIGLRRDLPAHPEAAEGSPAIAARRRLGPGVHEALLRSEHEMLCLAVTLAPAATEPTDWSVLDRQWAEVSGHVPDPLLHEARLYIARTAPRAEGAIQAAPDIARAARIRLPEVEERDGWWDRGETVGGRFALWETSRHDSRARRRILILAHEGPHEDLSEWTWHGGGLALPPLGRYLLHVSRLRYELGVWEREQQVRRLRGQADDAIAELQALLAAGSGGPAARTFGTVAEGIGDLRAVDTRLVGVSTRLRDMKRTVEIAADNMKSVLGRDEAAWDAPGMLHDDQDLATWFARQLEDNATYLENTQRRTSHMLGVAQDEVERRARGDATPGAGTFSTESGVNRTRSLASSQSERSAAVDLDGGRCQLTGADPTRLVVLAVVDEWSPGRGGLSTLNRHLCGALAAAGAHVFCVLPAPSQQDRHDATAAGVHLLNAPLTPGASEQDALMRRPPLPTGVRPDVIIGHGRVTGPAAKVLADDHFPEAARIHVIHMTPDEIEWWKPGRSDDAAVRAETRTQIELDLSRDAACVAAIGPRLLRRWSRELSGFREPPEIVRVDPGFDGPDLDREPPRGSPQILILGRLEDAEIKGLDIAARAIGDAVGHIDQLELRPDVLLRGAPPGGGSDLQARFLKWSGRPSLRVTPRNYSTDSERLQEDLRRSSLVMMPSRAEGFGLVGLEAILAGVPVLVSEESGLGELLRGVLSPEQAARVVVPVENDPSKDTPRWSTQIVAKLLDRRAAFAAASEVGRMMAGTCTWTAAAARLLHAVRPTSSSS